MRSDVTALKDAAKSLKTNVSSGMTAFLQHYAANAGGIWASSPQLLLGAPAVLREGQLRLEQSLAALTAKDQRPLSALLGQSGYADVLDCSRFAAAAYGVSYERRCFDSLSSNIALNLWHPKLKYASSTENGRAAVRMLQGGASLEMVVMQCSTKPYEMTGYVCVDHSSRTVVVAFRGTMSNGDLITDFSVASLPYYSGHAPYGFVRCIHSLQSNPTLVDALVGQMRAFPDYRVWITGHSLGAANAILFYAFVVHEKLLLPQRRCDVIAFAPPPCVDEHFCATVKPPQLHRVLAIVNSEDIVCRAQVASFVKLLERAAERGNLARECSMLHQVASSLKQYYIFGDVALVREGAHPVLVDRQDDVLHTPLISVGALRDHLLCSYTRRLARESPLNPPKDV